MENWVTFLLVNVVLVIVLGVITNLATPWVKSAYDKSILSSRQKRIKALINEYRMTKGYRSNLSLVILPLFVGLAYTLLPVLVALILFLFSWLWYTYDATRFSILIQLDISACLGLVLSSCYSVYQLIIMPSRRIGLFTEYTEKTKAKIKALGGNPEDLDKEEIP